MTGYASGSDQGGTYLIPADNAWHEISFSLSNVSLLTAVTASWYSAIFCLRTHDGIVDARYSVNTSAPQMFTCVVFCKA